MIIRTIALPQSASLILVVYSIFYLFNSVHTILQEFCFYLFSLYMVVTVIRDRFTKVDKHFVLTFCSYFHFRLTIHPGCIGIISHRHISTEFRNVFIYFVVVGESGCEMLSPLLSAFNCSHVNYFWVSLTNFTIFGFSYLSDVF